VEKAVIHVLLVEAQIADTLPLKAALASDPLSAFQVTAVECIEQAMGLRVCFSFFKKGVR